MKAILFKVAATVVGVTALLLTLGIAHNNAGDDQYTRDDLQLAFERSMHWLQQHDAEVQRDTNTMLWWMLLRAADMNAHATLQDTTARFMQQQAPRYRYSPWSYLVTGQSNPYISPGELGNNLPDYNLHFIYGFSCSRSLAAEDIIKIQNDTNFCWRHHPISPACTTHQLMGFRFMQRTGCEDQETVRNNIVRVSDFIRQQSIYDFRVVDVYIQRVLMQYDSGHQDKVNPRWIKRILLAQNADGGWGDFQPVLPLGGEKYLGFTSKAMGIRSPQSTFHATAQGIWLLTMLLQQQKPDISPANSLQ